MRLIYRPDHPQSNENGMVDRTLVGYEFEHNDAPHVISDIMGETRHMVDGKYYTSKSQFRRATKAAGCIEVGNEVDYMMKPRKPVPLSREQRRNDIRRSISDLRNGIRRE